MPLHNLNFHHGEIHRGPDILGDIIRGYKLGLMPQEAQREREAHHENMRRQMIENALNENYGAEERESKLGLQNAQTQNQLRQAQFGHLTGAAAQQYSIEMLRNQLGEDNPVYQRAKQAHELEVESQKLLNEQRQIYNKSAHKRFSTTQGKLSLEEQEIAQGLLPGTDGQIRLSPEQQQELMGQYENLRLKNTTDAGLRERRQYAINMDKTIDSINIDSLVKFSGPKGAAKRLAEQAKSLNGKSSKDYKDYEENLTKIKTFAKQFRQFNKDSVTNANQERLEYITNPTNWHTSPEIAKAKLEALFKLAKNENKTIENALKNPRELTGRQNITTHDFSGLSDMDIDKREAELREMLGTP